VAIADGRVTQERAEGPVTDGTDAGRLHHRADRMKARALP